MQKKEVRIPQQKRSIEKKERIIEAAFRVFNEKGYFATNTAEIAKEAGLSTGSVYAYFNDKKDILLACLRQFGDSFQHTLNKAMSNLSENDNILETLEDILKVFVSTHTQNRIYHDDVMSLQYRDEDVRAYFNSVQKSIISIIIEKVKENGYTFLYPHEQSFLIYQLVDNMEDELIFDHSPNINHDILIKECARIIYSMMIKKPKSKDRS